MPQVASTSSQELELVLAFEENGFDIAGLAELSLDDAALNLGLRELFSILLTRTEPRRSNRPRLARILLAMMTVARDDYAGTGHQEYWPFLFDRIEAVVSEDERGFVPTNLRSQPNQSLLGQWFRLALDEFGYTIPEEGTPYVTPVVFHAGIPRNSLPGALQLIDTAVRQYGRQAITLPYDLRSRLARNHFPPLHRNVKRLLVSHLRGASQLWSCLARVVFAWQSHGDCTEELQQLPAALDPVDVRQALPSKHATKASRRTRRPLPQIRFDASTGEVRLTVPTGTFSDWNVTAEGRNVDVRWTQTRLGLTAEFLSPPPEVISIAQCGGGDGRIGRTIATRPSHWPGIWFHASNGNIEDGATIDANGLEPGRWFVLFEGTPTDRNVPSVFRVPLKWSCFSGHEQWTAWEIEVPPRTQDRTSLEWSVDDNRFHVDLARRPGARVEPCAEPLGSAWTTSGEAVSVFADAPSVRLCRDRSLAVLLLRETSDDIEVFHQTELPPDQEWRVPVCEPGIYQLREARGVGRILLHFALIPGLNVSGPIYDVSKTRVAIEFSGTAGIGEAFAGDGEAIAPCNGTFRHEQSTVEPLIGFEWKWHDVVASPLRFQWSVEGLRWRVLRLSDEVARWTREPIFVSPKAAQKHDAQLEIQFPAKSELRVNDVIYSDKLSRGGNGNGVTLSLLPFGDVVQVSVDSEDPRPAVVLNDRPVVDRIEAISDGDSVLLSWECRTIEQGTVIVAWNPCDSLAAATPIPLIEKQLKECTCEIVCSDLPGESWTSFSIARSVRIGFSRQVLQLASDRVDITRPVSLLLNRETGEIVSPNADAPATWVELLHGLTLDRLNSSPRTADQIADALAHLSAIDAVDLQYLFTLQETLTADDDSVASTSSTSDSKWRNNILQALTQHLGQMVRKSPLRIFRSAANTQTAALLENLLRMGIPVGQSCPLQWLSEDVSVDDIACVYPFRFVCDLWLLGTCEVDAVRHFGTNGGQRLSGFLERQKDAAGRVWEFLQSHDLSFATQLLPISQKTATAPNTDRGHFHSVALLPRAISTATEFANALGLEDLGFDGHSTCDDQFWTQGHTFGKGGPHSTSAKQISQVPAKRQHLTPDYSLYWCRDERQWYVERPGKSPPTCCHLSTAPLTVPSIVLATLPDRISLRELLANWATLDANRENSACSPQLLELLTERLRSDPVTGALHREILAATEAEKKKLFGTVISVAMKSAVSERARVAWLIAWSDRLSAWMGAKQLFPDESSTQGLHAEFLRVLGEACRTWPRLIERCLALAELLIWTYYRGGLGIAIRFSSRINNQPQTSRLATRTAVPTTKPPLTSFVSDAANEKEVVVTGATGVIVAYDGGTGRILIKHPNSPSLAATVNAYVEPKPDSHSWLARFDWRVIDENDRKKLEEVHASSRQHLGSSRAATLADTMCGMTVRCELRKAPKWEVTAMRIVFNGQRFSIPSRLRQTTEL